MTRRYYECEICGGIHHWEWNGDCREKHANVTDEVDSLEADGIDVEILSMADRIAADVMEWKNNEEENAIEQKVADIAMARAESERLKALLKMSSDAGFEMAADIEHKANVKIEQLQEILKSVRSVILDDILFEEQAQPRLFSLETKKKVVEHITKVLTK